MDNSVLLWSWSVQYSIWVLKICFDTWAKMFYYVWAKMCFDILSIMCYVIGNKMYLALDLGSDRLAYLGLGKL